MSTCGPASDIATSTVAVDEHRDNFKGPEHDDGDGDFISFSESAPLRPFSLLPTLDAEDSERPSFLSLTPDPTLEVPAALSLPTTGDSSFLSFTDTPPASSTPDPLSGSETLSVVQEEEEEGEEEEEEEEDIGGETRLDEEEHAQTKGAGVDDSEEIDLGDAILLESGRSENVVVEVDKDPESDSEQQTSTHFYYDKELKRWVGKKPGH